MPRLIHEDPEVLQAALIGLRRMLDEVKQQMGNLRRRLGEDTVAQPAPAKRTMSAAARHRIALAQKKRWATFQTKKKAAQPEAKRELSAAGRARIIAATKKRWAAVRKAQKAAAQQAAGKAPLAKAVVVAEAPAPAVPVPAAE